jgi:hypothetical protein
MNTYEFLNEPGAPSPVQFAAALNMTSAEAVRQWSKDPHRKPAPEWAPAVEVKSGLKCRRWDMYPQTWWRIWPELVGTPGAPPLPEGAEPVLPDSHIALR